MLHQAKRTQPTTEWTLCSRIVRTLSGANRSHSLPTRTLYPFRSALCTIFRVMSRSVQMYSWNHRGESPEAAATSSRLVVERVLKQNSAPTSRQAEHAKTKKNWMEGKYLWKKKKKKKKKDKDHSFFSIKLWTNTTITPTLDSQALTEGATQTKSQQCFDSKRKSLIFDKMPLSSDTVIHFYFGRVQFSEKRKFAVSVRRKFR